MIDEKKEFSRMAPRVREMVMMKYYSNMFENMYQINERKKQSRALFLKRQEKAFKASGEQNLKHSRKH